LSFLKPNNFLDYPDILITGIMVKSIEKFVEEFHGWSFPIDLYKICEKLGVKVEQTALPKYLKGYYNRKERCIYLNSGLNKHSSRFFLAREIRPVIIPYLKSDFEKNSFAQELLMPSNEFIKIWNRSYPTQVKECGRYFDVSEDAVIIKAKKLYEKEMLSELTYGLFTDIFKDIKPKKQ
jgi:Zn-dependent peptidase ImmA (M78 family)